MSFLVTDPADPIAALARLYEVMLGREGDGPGLAFWAGQIDAGAASLADVARSFALTREFADLYGDAEDLAAFVTAAFQRAYGREAEPAALEFWTTALGDGLSRAEFLAEVAASAEARAKIDVIGEDGLDIPDFAAPTFAYGVASGDPEADSVVLWTHARPAGTDGPVTVGWEVATDEGFSEVVASGEAVTSAAEDHTVKVIPEGLAAGETYFYRFTAGGETSATGTTRTLPEGALDQLVLAVFSCSNYFRGFFNPYAAAAENGFDFSVHLGDFIYEDGPGGFATGIAEEIGRVPSPPRELVSNADYDGRYQQYLSDPDLKAVRAEAPMIMMWDDHETADNAFAEGAVAHDPATEGDWFARRDAALEAYFDWNPVREPESGDLTDFDRSFDFGDLATLHMLETRLQARDETVNGDPTVAVQEVAARYLADPTGQTFAADVARFPALVPDGVDPTDPAQLLALSQDPAFVGVLALNVLIEESRDPERDMIGDRQFEEFAGRLEASEATWQIIGSQTLMSDTLLPQPLLLDTANTAAAYLTIAAKIVAGAPLTAEEEALLNAPRTPFNFDAWDGYAAEREQILEALIDKGAGSIVLAGDTHNSWFGSISTEDGRLAAWEFGGPGVSAPGLEEAIPDFSPAQLETLFVGLDEERLYADLSRRGYMEVTVTPEAVSTDFVFVDNVDTPEFGIDTVTQTVPLDSFV